MCSTWTERSKDFSVFNQGQINHMPKQINSFFTTGTTQVVSMYTHICICVQTYNLSLNMHLNLNTYNTYNMYI